MLGPTELAAIDELQRRWLACELEGRPSDVLHLCSPDVVWLPPEQWPLRGTAAIRAWLATAHDRVEQVRLTNVTWMVTGTSPTGRQTSARDTCRMARPRRSR